MKNYLLGFLAIISIGFTVALLGSNNASSMLAALFTVDTPSSILTIASTTPTIDGGDVPLPVITRTIVLNGLTTNQQLSEVHVLSASVNDSPSSVTFHIKNIGTTDEKSLVADCTNTQEIKRECRKEVDTRTMERGKYAIVAEAAYTDGVKVRSVEVSVYINNVNPVFVFDTLPNPAAGEITIAGAITEATAVEFMYMQSGATQQIRIGNAVRVETGVTGKWMYRWDTRQATDGVYTVLAKVTSIYNGNASYVAGEIAITVVNKEPEPVIPPVIPSVMPPVIEEPLLNAGTLTDALTTMTVADATSTDPKEFVTQVQLGDRDTETVLPINTEPPVQPVIVSTVTPIAQRIQSISTGLQGGSSETFTRELEVLKEELWGDVNPASPAVRAKTQYQSAKTFGTTVNASVMQVANIAFSTTTAQVVVSVATTTEAGKKMTVNVKRNVVKEKLRLAGKALPDIYVTIYIYSEVPTIAVVKTDRNGNWVYELDNKLADGDHEAYVTINDKTGKVVAKSQRFGFVKTAEAVTVEDLGALGRVEASTGDPIQPAQVAEQRYAKIMMLLIGAGLLTGIFLMLRAPKKEGQNR